MKIITWNDLMDQDYNDDYDNDDYDNDDYDNDDYDNDDYVEPLDEDEFIDGASSSFPFQLTIPANLNEILQKDSQGPSSDSNGTYKNKMWSTVWPNVTPDVIDPAQSAADYYLLFGLVNNSFVEFEEIEYPSSEEIQQAGEILGEDQKIIDEQKKIAEEKILADPRFKLTELSKKADVVYHNLVTNLDKCFREYVHLACGGELRHHQACSPSMGGYRRGAWVKWFYIYEQNGPESLLKMADLFEEFGGGSYGGPPWANAARILYQREMGELGPDDFTNKQLFVDRVFTLEHNGGCFLNKLDWINLRKGRQQPYNRHFAEMKDYVLNAHASNPTNIDMLLGYASQEVIDLTLSYFAIANDNNIEIIGNWAGKKAKVEKVNTETFSTTEKVKQNSGGVIDWSDYDMKDDNLSVEDALLQQLEKSLLDHKKSIENLNEGFSKMTDTINHTVETFGELGNVSWSDIKVKWID